MAEASKRSADSDPDGRRFKRAKDLKEVAGMALALSAMVQMRSGNEPTEAEREMMEEARRKLGEVCEGFSPAEVFPVEEVKGVMEDLGLDKVKRQMALQFTPPPRFSIAQKVKFSNAQFEKAEANTFHSAKQFAHGLQINKGVVAESRGAQLPATEVRSPLVSCVLPTNRGKNLARVDYLTQLQGSAPGGHAQPAWSQHAQSASGASNLVPPQNLVKSQGTMKVEGATCMTTSRMGTQETTPRRSITQSMGSQETTPRQSIAQPTINQQMPRTNVVQTSLPNNSHNGICRNAHNILQQYQRTQPALNPPSRDYMQKSITCQVCNLGTDRVENVIVCDACEKGYHLSCHQIQDLRTIPKGDWYCFKCLVVIDMKPLPPKYGRVRRKLTAPGPAVPSIPVPTAAPSSSSPLKPSKIVNKVLDSVQACSKVQGNSLKVSQCGDGIPSKQYHDNYLAAEKLEKFDISKSDDGNLNVDAKQGNIGISSDGSVFVDWIGEVAQVADEKTYYSSCCINGSVYQVNDYALFMCNNKEMPSKIQTMWEDNMSRSKWVLVNRCYFPGDLPEAVGHPCSLDGDEVYESNHACTIMAGLIQGPCEVLGPGKFLQESQRRSLLRSEEKSRLPPLFQCKWFYNEIKGSFREFSSVS